MRIFHRLVFEGYVNSSSSTANFSDHLSTIDMANVDIISIGGYAAQVSGTSPTLTINLWGSFETFLFQSYGSSPISALSLSTTEETLFQAVGPNPKTSSRPPYLGLSLSMGGTNPRGFFRVWVTGRDRSRRSRPLAQHVSDTTDLPDFARSPAAM